MTSYHYPPRPRSVFSDAVSPVAPRRRRLRSRGKRCTACGCILAQDHHAPKCTPCNLRDPYDPRTDGDFPRKLADYLARHLGRRVNPCAYFNVVPQARYYVYRRIVDLQRAGWIITGTRGAGGGYLVAAIPARKGGTL